MNDWYCEELLTGKTPVERLFEDESVIAFWHTRPHYTHHVVITPRYHVESLLECDTGTLTSLFEVVKAIGAQFIAEHGGAHIVTNLGKYQDSKHLHFHIGAD